MKYHRKQTKDYNFINVALAIYHQLPQLNNHQLNLKCIIIYFHNQMRFPWTIKSLKLFNSIAFHLIFKWPIQLSNYASDLIIFSLISHKKNYSITKHDSKHETKLMFNYYIKKNKKHLK